MQFYVTWAILFISVQLQSVLATTNLPFLISFETTVRTNKLDNRYCLDGNKIKPCTHSKFWYLKSSTIGQFLNQKTIQLINYDNSEWCLTYLPKMRNVKLQKCDFYGNNLWQIWSFENLESGQNLFVDDKNGDRYYLRISHSFSR